MPKKSTLLEDEHFKTDGHFRIAIFGSARILPEDPMYREVYDLARSIGEKGFDIITGGGPGIMEAANSGHKAGNNGNGAHSIGLTIKLPLENANTHLDIKEHFERFSERLDMFMTLAEVVIVMPGGIGTLLEFFYSWQLTQVKHICNIPIILRGEMWEELMKWIENYPVKLGYIGTNDLKNVLVARNNAEVVAKIDQLHEIYKREGPNFCLNFKKYRIS